MAGGETLIDGIGTKQRQATVVEVARYTHLSATGFPDGNLYAFIEEMRGLLDRVPLEYRSKVALEFSDRAVWVWYARPETEDEEKKRLEESEAQIVEEIRTMRVRAEQLLARAGSMGIPAARLGLELLDGATDTVAFTR